MNNPIRVLMLTTNSSLIDGINRHILNVCTELTKRNDIKVGVCIVNSKGELHEELKKNDVEVFSLGYRNGHALGIFSKFRKVIKEFNPDIIHSHVMAMNERIYLSLFGGKIKFASTIHGIADPKPNVSWRDRLERKINRRFKINQSAVCYISNGVKEALDDDYKSEIIKEVIYNPIDFENAPKRNHLLHDMLNISHSTPIIGTACRMADQKYPEAFTSVLCETLKNYPQVHAVVIGTGDENLTKRCKAIVESYNVSERFHWIGYQKNAPELIAGLSCFVMTSHCEGLPTSVLESITAHTPVAMLEGEGGLKDIVAISSPEKPIVLHSPKGDWSGLSKQIGSLLQDKDLSDKMAENAFEVGKENFSVSSIAYKLINLYKSIACR